MQYQVTRLSNGITVATSRMPQMASVGLAVWVGVGGRYETAGLNGVSHFIEHMLFKGTQRRSSLEITQAVEGIGGYLNAYTTEENTCYYSRARHDRWKDLLEVLIDMYVGSTFHPLELKKERHVIKDEVAMYLDQPQQLVQDLLCETLWPNHPLGRPITGSLQSVNRLTRAGILNFHRQHYVGVNTIVTAAGNLNHDDLVKGVKRLTRSIPTGQPSFFTTAPTSQTQPRLCIRRKKTAQTQLAIGFRCLSRQDDRRFALRLLSTLLGENMSSRLFQVLREDHGLAYSVQTSLNLFDEVGYLGIYAGMEPDQLKKSMSLIVRELNRLQNTLPSRSELKRAKDYLIGQMDLSLESTENRASWLGEQLLAFKRIIPDSYARKMLNEVRPSEIRQLSRETFQPDRLSLSLVSPKPTRQALELLGQLSARIT